MLRSIIEAFTPHEPTYVFRVGSAYPVEIPESVWHLYMPINPAHNIAEAQKSGIRPVNYYMLQTQFSERQLQESVLFDTPADGISSGNHWRVMYIDKESDKVDLQLCGNFGNHDAQILPITVSMRDILFTGIATMSYIRNRQRMTLAEVIEEYSKRDTSTLNAEFPKDISWIGETIYFADQNGKLIPYDKHPLFAQK